ncbi:MAG: KamA family radical SAM protein [Eubacteriales bacterium]|nr:KamA family radical SAM protein [Eubacteriales bacterium]MDD7550354.1 KamA family radical SAM protein [Clostridia bacterium]MDY5755153.1 KamA family radical SAM protein [Eubacteriales bacterium]
MWQDQIKNGIRNSRELSEYIALTPKQREQCDAITRMYPMMITPYYISLADKSDPDDPIRRMCVPSIDENDPSGVFDTSGEATNFKAAGVQHKYAQTALILSTNQCAMYCRHCFRKRLIGLSEDELNKRADDAISYVANHPQITNVLISGGDALMNGNAVIEKYLAGLSQIEHLAFIRIGSRMPVVLPERIYGDTELLDILARYAKVKTIVIVTQFNHPKELTEQAATAIRALQDLNIQIRNQTVLLKGVNDNPNVLGSLLSGLTGLGVIPYYVFQCRPVKGVKGRFQVPLRIGAQIVDGAKAMQNGFGKAVRYCMSHPLGKIEILGAMANGNMLFKFHQNKYRRDESRIFTRRISDTDTWLDEDLEGI